ncbi:hypothetical protein AMK59_1477 [Oryctes borbonicus]|uniref:Tc1-like transposase DDE domain-containing protein n=1 Tax=Oryctes borbonicus TaxID=1629725 RepID=A0A0T6BE70_9SCAR|nr:hypothetical protein AMK59_1477 [Oryctes borbonicus]
MYTDGSWVNTGLFANKVWADSTVNSKRQVLVEGVSTGITAPRGRGQRFALIRVGNENGFVAEAKFTFLCKRNVADAHDEICGDIYEKWFTEQLLPSLPNYSVIIMDNGSYHSGKLEVLPRSNWRKDDIRLWSENKHIPVE